MRESLIETEAIAHALDVNRRTSIEPHKVKKQRPSIPQLSVIANGIQTLHINNTVKLPKSNINASNGNSHEENKPRLGYTMKGRSDGSLASLHSQGLGSTGSLFEESDLVETPMISKVEERLFIGNEDICKSENAIEILKSYGITHVINMAAEVKTPTTASTCPIMFINFPVYDSPDEDILGILNEVVNSIDHCLISNENSKVFVHCKAGKSRSASAIIAYYILKRNLSYSQAFRILKKARPAIDPNIGFVMVLMSLERKPE